MTSPAVCMHEGDVWNPAKTKFFFLNGNKKVVGSFLDGRIKGELFQQWDSDTERFLLNAHAIKAWVKPRIDMKIVVEGYAFGATGSRIFQIGEATGILKTLLIHGTEGSLLNRGKNLVTCAPSANKKFATTKGNADKQMMYDAFVADTGLDLVSTLGMKALGSPAHDLADAYFLCKYGFSMP